MKYTEWNPTIHTMKDDPQVGLTYAWNALTKGTGSTHQPNRLDVGQDLFDAFEKLTKRRYQGGYPCFKTLTMHSTGKPGWDYAFSRE